MRLIRKKKSDFGLVVSQSQSKVEANMVENGFHIKENIFCLFFTI